MFADLDGAVNSLSLFLLTVKTISDEMLGGVTIVKGTLDNGSEFQAIPYYAWAHRGQGEMAVWLRSE